jgi:RNA polymerase sigma-70 factor (ECF subfamily)
MKRIEEKLLLYKIITKRDSESYGILYDQYIEKIYRFVFFKVRSKEDAEDVTSDVFLKAWHYLTEKSPSTVESISGLLFSIARNAIIDHYREKAKKPMVSLEVVEDLLTDQKDIELLDQKADVEKMIGLIKKMKHDYQEVLILKYVEDLKLSEISKILGKNSINTRVLLHRAVKKLKELSGQ